MGMAWYRSLAVLCMGKDNVEMLYNLYCFLIDFLTISV